MENGYRVAFHSVGESWGKELPHMLSAGENLDSDIEQIGVAIRDWVLSRQDGSFGHLSISLFGPMGGLSRTPPLTPEETLAESKSQVERFYALGDVAQSRFNAGDFDAARAYALELQKMMLSYDGNWNYGNAVASSNIVLGRLALKDGNIEEAEAFLIEAGKSPGSPQMDSFGPNMSLAQDLLLAGHDKAVLGYFGLCSKFWTSESSKLEKWTEDVNAGRIPDFGANLVY